MTWPKTILIVLVLMAGTDAIAEALATTRCEVVRTPSGTTSETSTEVTP